VATEARTHWSDFGFVRDGVNFFQLARSCGDEIRDGPALDTFRTEHYSVYLLNWDDIQMVPTPPNLKWIEE
jgi:hypothetical protein